MAVLTSPPLVSSPNQPQTAAVDIIKLLPTGAPVVTVPLLATPDVFSLIALAGGYAV